MATLLADDRLALAADQAVNQSIRSIGNDPAFPAMNLLPEPDLRTWCKQAVEAVAMWTAGQDFAPVMHAFAAMGREGQRLGVPGRELVHAIDVIIDACHGIHSIPGVGSQPFPGSHELRPLDTFTDFAKYYLIRGYEEGSR